jgi:hypothetical protein
MKLGFADNAFVVSERDVVTVLAALAVLADRFGLALGLVVVWSGQLPCIRDAMGSDRIHRAALEAALSCCRQSGVQGPCIALNVGLA